MNAFESTLATFATRLHEAGVRYMVIGGFANLHWGRARFTQDLDVTVAVTEDALAGLMNALAPAFRSLVKDPVAFARETALVPLESHTGIPIDMVLARLALEHEAIARAITIEVGDAAVQFATPEDLILHKIISERPRDREDIEGIVRRQRGKLELDYLRPRIRALSDALERPTMVAEFERLISE
ncbi:MAG: nucleotidyltransferase [Candidatus Eisenbacteria bacterium]